MPPQLKRLLPLFAVVILLFFVARHFLVPESFGKYGHYRYNSVIENRSKAMHYAGKEACKECHSDKATLLQSDVHSTLSCETCHGPGVSHCASPEKVHLDIPKERVFCGICHDFNPSRSKFVQQVDIKEHHIDKARCIECHNPHAPWQLKK